MKLYLVTVDVPVRIRRLLWCLGLPLAVAVAAGVAYAAPLHQWMSGEALSAADLNANFGELEARIQALEAQVDTLSARAEPLPDVSLRYVLAASQSIPPNADTVVGNPSTPWTRVWDSTNGTAFSSISGIFTAPEPGTYLITAAVTWNGRSTGFSNRFWINGSSTGQNFLDNCAGCAASAPFMQAGSYTARLAKDDTIFLQVHTDGASAALTTDSRANYIQINLIGR